MGAVFAPSLRCLTCSAQTHELCAQIVHGLLSTSTSSARLARHVSVLCQSQHTGVLESAKGVHHRPPWLAVKCTHSGLAACKPLFCLQIDSLDDGPATEDGSVDGVLRSIASLLRSSSEQQRRAQSVACAVAAQGPTSPRQVVEMLEGQGFSVEECTTRQGPAAAAQWLQSLKHSFLLCTLDGAPLRHRLLTTRLVPTFSLH